MHTTMNIGMVVPLIFSNCVDDYRRLL